MLLAACMLGCASQMSGCWIAAVAGGMAESYKESSTRTVEAEYLGLEGHSYAVVVAADRAIQADFPSLTSVITDRINGRLFQHSGATGFIPTQTGLTYLLNRPQWTAMPLGELAEELGVERLVFIEIWEYRLNDPGNSYLWEGVAQASVGVIDPTSALPDEFVFEKQVRVGFPDGPGFGPAEISRKVVSSALLSRLVDRASWLFYDHQEPYYPKY